MKTSHGVGQKRGKRKISSAKLKSQRNGGKTFKGTRKYPSKHSKLPHEIKVLAPEYIDLYSPKKHLKTLDFMMNLDLQTRLADSSKSIVRICFRNTTGITAAAGILLLANIETLVSRYPNVLFRITRPPTTPSVITKKADNVIHAVLQRIGVYNVLRVGKFKTKYFPHVDRWYIGSSTEVHGKSLGNAIKQTESLGVIQNKLYRSCIEAVSNAVEHAYSDKVPTNFKFPLKKWWIFVGEMENRLVILVCDKGHGIPKTLPYTQSKSLLDQITANMQNLYKTKEQNIPVAGDVAQIQAATLVKETRTNLNHRGKGGADIKSFVKAHDGAKLAIHSNKGVYKYIHKNSKFVDLGYNNHHSIGGTIIEWSIPIINPQGAITSES